MSLLFDQNLSRRLVALLAGDYPGSQHAIDAGLIGADDPIVWRYAAAHGLAVVTKDAELRHLALVHRFAAQGGLAACRQWSDGGH